MNASPHNRQGASHWPVESLNNVGLGCWPPARTVLGIWNRFNKFSVKQLSSRGSELSCEIVGDRVFIAGRAVKYLAGKIEIES